MFERRTIEIVEIEKGGEERGPKNGRFPFSSLALISTLTTILSLC